MKNAVFWIVFLLLFCGAGVATIAIKEFEQADEARLENVHAAGMVVGAALCGGRT